MKVNSTGYYCINSQYVIPHLNHVTLVGKLYALSCQQGLQAREKIKISILDDELVFLSFTCDKRVVWHYKKAHIAGE